MLLWSVLALVALGAVSEDKVATETGSSRPTPTATPDAVNDPEPIPYSNGSGQIFKTSDELIQSFRRQESASPELPAVITSGQLSTKIPSKELEAPLETITPVPTNNTGSAISSPGSISSLRSTISPPGSTIGTPGSTISTPGSAPPVPPRPTFNRSLHLRDELIVPSSGYTEVYDISWHAETNTALTVLVDPGTFIFRIPQPDDQIQFLKNEESRALGSVQRICTKSPLLPASPKDKTFPGLPDMEPFQFLDYTSEDGRQVERWQYVVFGKPGEAGAVREESFNITHDFFVYRDGGYAVPLRYTVVTDSSILGPVSDSYTHRYSPLPAPTGPVLTDTAPMCTIWNEFRPESGRTENPPKKLDAKELEDILTPTLL